MTFQTAHRYLGLTAELLRTERAINDIACHPLPRSFYEGGGVERLRGRFQEGGSDGEDEDTQSQDGSYFDKDVPVASSSSSSRRVPTTTSEETVTAPLDRGRKVQIASPIAESAAPDRDLSQESSRSTRQYRTSPATPFKASNSRLMINAGDLMTSTGAGASNMHPHPLSRQWSILKTPGITSPRIEDARKARFSQTDDFDLRDEVMSCIAKSIGLMQPPSVSIPAVDTPGSDGEDGVAASGTSPLRSPNYSRTKLNKSGASNAGTGVGLMNGGAAMFNASFSTLLNDRASSMTGGSSSIDPRGASDDYMSGLDNEVEILCFKAGSYLVRAGEKNAGKYWAPLPLRTPRWRRR